MKIYENGISYGLIICFAIFLLQSVIKYLHFIKYTFFYSNFKYLCLI